MHAERLSQLETDSDCPGLISSSEPEDSDDEDPDEDSVKGKEQVGAQSGQQSNVPVQQLLKLSSFELCESDDDTEGQVEDIPEVPYKQDAPTTDIHGENCVSSLSCTAKRSSSNVNSQSDCSNVSQNFGLTANSA